MLALVLAWLPQGSVPAAIDPERAAEAFGEAEEAALADDGRLWGHSLVGPMLFAEPRSRVVVANQPDEEGHLVELHGVFTGVLPTDVPIANTGTHWAGVRWTMVMWPLPAERHARVQLLLHESFHRIQPQLPHAGVGPLPAHLDEEAARTWLRLEFRALARALTAPRAEREPALADALLFRARRRQLFPTARASESALEHNEGLAEYTGLVLCGLDARAQAERAARRLLADEREASFVRSFAYASGPAYGLLLDEHGGGWRGVVRADVDLADELARHGGWSAPVELARAAEEAAARHGGDEVVREEQNRAAERVKVEAALRARLVDGPVLTLELGADVRFSFDPNRVTTLAGIGTVYEGARVSEAWGVLDAETGGVLFVAGPDGALRAARVPAPRDAATRPPAGAGWSLELARGWTLAPDTRAGDWKLVRTP